MAVVGAMAGLTVMLLNHLAHYWYVSTPVTVLLATIWWLQRHASSISSSPKTSLTAEQQRLNKLRREQTESRKMRKNVVEAGGVGDSDDSNGDDIVPADVPQDIPHVIYQHKRRTLEDSYTRSKQFYELMNERRSVRFFSKEPVPTAIIENIIRTAGTAPSGAHTEPWRFLAIKDPDCKQKIREIVEQEEEINYAKRMGLQWTSDLKGFRTNAIKEYLTDAPWILIVFKQLYMPLPDGRKRNNYYHEISTALSGGILLAAIQNAGLVTLTSTPMNCGLALKTLLKRPAYEKLLLLLPVGYASADCRVPDLKRKELADILTLV